MSRWRKCKACNGPIGGMDQHHGKILCDSCLDQGRYGDCPVCGSAQINGAISGDRDTYRECQTCGHSWDVEKEKPSPKICERCKVKAKSDFLDSLHLRFCEGHLLCFKCRIDWAEALENAMHQFLEKAEEQL